MTPHPCSVSKPKKLTGLPKDRKDIKAEGNELGRERDGRGIERAMGMGTIKIHYVVYDNTNKSSQIINFMLTVVTHPQSYHLGGQANLHKHFVLCRETLTQHNDKN